AAGIQHVVARRDYLNAINVFPVPDGDTGTNIAFTLHAVLHAMTENMHRHAGRMLDVVAAAALDGARGNSGAILAQFFQGLGEKTAALHDLSAAHFVAAVNHGAAAARTALAQPMEGTLLTVLADFAAALQGHLAQHHAADISSLLNTGLARAKTSLANTPNQLQVLKQAGVVDAGAQGFVDLVQGIVDFLQAGSMEALPADTILPMVSHERGTEADSHYRYCTECLISGDNLERTVLSRELAELGDSLVVAGGARKLRVHIHADGPDAVFRIAARYGQISGEKADDMRRQARVAGRRLARPAIITDSGADIPEALRERLDIHMLPVRVHFGEHAYLDKVSLTPADFYRELRLNPLHPKTSQPPPGDFRREFNFLASHYDAVVYIGLTSKVSGTVQAAVAAANRADGTPVTVLDSGSVSAGQGLLAVYAAECALAGYDAAAIVQAVKAMLPRTRIWGAIPDLSYAVRGGRVRRSTKLLADLLHLTPVLTATPDGHVTSCGVLWGRNRRAEKFARFVTRHVNAHTRYRLLVGHCDCAEDAERLRTLLIRIPNIESSWLTEVGPALGTHAGPGALVVSLQVNQPVT
ncbi:MAG: DegV family EDD domain-containing protein, partial [Gammaproteobacteria bacterium]|nr:DegV family EDD domain-containing protein [Gammaproteobacteria bacterium]